MKRQALESRLRARRQSGFAAIAAIFLVVVLAALGGFMLSFSNTQQITSVQDQQGTRAYWAARAGLEFGLGTVAATAACPSGANPRLLTVDSFTVCVTCVVQVYTEAAASPNVSIFRVTSVARAPALASCASAGAVGSVGYVERSVSASIEK
jgi:MSHA biogenesis protein MshP